MQAHLHLIWAERYFQLQLIRAATISRLKSVRNNQVVIGKINVIEPSFDIQPGGFGKYKESFVFQIGNT